MAICSSEAGDANAHRDGVNEISDYPKLRK